MKNVLPVIIEKKYGVAIAVDKDKKLSGIIVDGDIKRILLKSPDMLKKPASEFMTRKPTTIDSEELIAKALKIMEGKITSLVIVNNKAEPVGLLHIHDILKAGIY